jgi:hypothetical protein
MGPYKMQAVIAEEHLPVHKERRNPKDATFRGILIVRRELMSDLRRRSNFPQIRPD